MRARVRDLGEGGRNVYVPSRLFSFAKCNIVLIRPSAPSSSLLLPPPRHPESLLLLLHYYCAPDPLVPFKGSKPIYRRRSRRRRFAIFHSLALSLEVRRVSGRAASRLLRRYPRANS